MIGLTLTSSDGSITGTIASVKIASNGATAVLTDGKEVPITSGVTLGYQ
jgi:flagellar basal-body rod modification protein FlgD